MPCWNVAVQGDVERSAYHRRLAREDVVVELLDAAHQCPISALQLVHRRLPRGPGGIGDRRPGGFSVRVHVSGDPSITVRA